MALCSRLAPLVVLIVGSVASGCASNEQTARAESEPEPDRSIILPGSAGSFEFAAYGPLRDRALRVWYDAPSGDLSSVPVLIVMHGQQRDGERYRDDWTPHVRSRRALLIVPEFPEDSYPAPEGYNLGNLITEEGVPVREPDWSFSVIEPLFDFVQRETGNRRSGYSLYGHSAGAQFVHRFVQIVPDNRVERAVAANAGWYTLPDTAVAFPYGLAGSPASTADLRRALGFPLTVLLGEDDVDTDDDSLRSTPEAEAQGPNRLARGRFFFAAGQRAAKALGVRFAWTLATVPNAAHEDSEMAPTAAEILLP